MTTLLLFLFLSDLLIVVEAALLIKVIRRLPRRGRMWALYYRLRWFVWPEFCRRIGSLPRQQEQGKPGDRIPTLGWFARSASIREDFASDVRALGCPQQEEILV